MSPISISGYILTPGSLNAAAQVIAVSSVIVKIVGPEVCWICITSPWTLTTLPIEESSSVSILVLLMFFLTFLITYSPLKTLAGAMSTSRFLSLIWVILTNT